MDPSIRKLSLSAVLHIIVPAKREGMLTPLVMLTVCIYQFRPHSRSSSRRAAVLSVPLRSGQPLPDRSGAPVEAIVTVASRRARGKEMLGHAQAVANRASVSVSGAHWVQIGGKTSPPRLGWTGWTGLDWSEIDLNWRNECSHFWQKT